MSTYYTYKHNTVVVLFFLLREKQLFDHYTLSPEFPSWRGSPQSIKRLFFSIENKTKQNKNKKQKTLNAEALPYQQEHKTSTEGFKL